MKLIPVLAALAVLGSGCFAADPGKEDGAVEPPVPPLPAEYDPLGGFEDPLVIDHDHADLSLHEFMTPTMEVVGTLGLEAEGAVRLAEADFLSDTILVVASTIGGVFLVDVSSPESPSLISRIPIVGYTADVKASPTGSFLFVGVQQAGFTGVQAYNVATPSAPVFGGAFPLTVGCHMLDVYEGHLYCAPNDASIRIFRIHEAAGAVALVPVSTYAPNGVPVAPVVAAPVGNPTHDMTVQADPLTGRPVMFVSFWDNGVHAVDVADPAQPKFLGSWSGDDSADFDGNLHTSMAFAVDGRRIIATVPEWSVQPAAYLLDATDFSAITLAGVWAPKPQEDYEGRHMTFSTHNFQVVQGRLYLAMYHGGVWVVDVATQAAIAEPAAAAYFIVHEHVNPPPWAPTVLDGGPSVWDVVVHNGYVYATDSLGLFVLHYVPDRLGDPAITSFA